MNILGCLTADLRRVLAKRKEVSLLSADERRNENQKLGFV
jgi:hypothetical protein